HQHLNSFPTRRSSDLPGFGEAKKVPELPFIVGTGSESGPRERVILIPGHGMFMNGLMVQTDNDNWEFSQNCIRWLNSQLSLSVRSEEHTSELQSQSNL